jgi:hypothetical protein
MGASEDLERKARFFLSVFGQKKCAPNLKKNHLLYRWRGFANYGLFAMLG